MISLLLHISTQYSHIHIHTHNSQFTFEANALCAFDNSARAVFCFITFLRTIRFLYPLVFSFRTTHRLFLYSWCFLLILLSPWDGKCVCFRHSTLFTWFRKSKLRKKNTTSAINRPSVGSIPSLIQFHFRSVQPKTLSILFQYSANRNKVINSSVGGLLKCSAWLNFSPHIISHRHTTKLIMLTIGHWQLQ